MFSNAFNSGLAPDSTALCESQLPPPSRSHTTYSSAAPFFQATW